MILQAWQALHQPSNCSLQGGGNLQRDKNESEIWKNRWPVFAIHVSSANVLEVMTSSSYCPPSKTMSVELETYHWMWLAGLWNVIFSANRISSALHTEAGSGDKLGASEMSWFPKGDKGRTVFGKQSQNEQRSFAGCVSFTGAQSAEMVNDSFGASATQASHGTVPDRSFFSMAAPTCSEFLMGRSQTNCCHEDWEC